MGSWLGMDYIDTLKKDKEQFEAKYTM